MRTLDITEAGFRTSDRLARKKGRSRPQLHDAAAVERCQYARNNQEDGMIRFARSPLFIFMTLSPAASQAADGDAFPDGVYDDFSKAWFKVSYAILGTGLTFPEKMNCFKDQKNESEINCGVGNDNFSLFVFGKSPMNGKGVKTIMVKVKNYKDIDLEKNLMKIAAGIIDRSLINDWQFNLDVDKALVAAKFNGIFRPTLRVFVAPSDEDGGITALVVPPAGALKKRH
jgi:hypothetical protein